MAKRNRDVTSATIERRLKEGRGQGAGIDYKPWLLVQDVPSNGLATRLKGWTTGRVHHLFSNLELMLFLILDWAPGVVDIREQYPLLPREETLAIAEKCGYRHPTDPKTKQPIVMTTDFVLTIRQPVTNLTHARCVKPSQGDASIQARRTLEKLEIERRYWEARHVDWGIVTERDIPEVLAKNVKWVHRHRDVASLPPLTPQLVLKIASALELEVVERRAPLSDLTNQCDDLLGLPAGASLTAVRHLIASGVWVTDMRVPFSPSRELPLLSVNRPDSSIRRATGR